MTKIKQISQWHWRGPEEDGYTPNFYTTEYAAQHYPFGMFVQQEPLQPMNKEIHFNSDRQDKDSLKKHFLDFASGAHRDYLDMRVASVLNRGYLTHLIPLLLILLALTHIFMPWQQQDIWIIAAIFLFCHLDIFRPVATPVRFHRRNQEVYVWHKKYLYRIPWQQCEISAMIARRHSGQGSLDDGYQLVLWLNPQHAMNKSLDETQYRALVLVRESHSHHRIYGYWEYVRRFMMQDFPYCQEQSTKPRPLFHPLLRHKWPERVHEWTGEKCTWL